ncbi:MAG: EI24 domain-containing protein [Planctomycetota bacterium]|nr:EI24 domain-containing protein [Planctomycetota bacterium]
MARPPIVPCPLCGYHAPDRACPACGLAPREASLAAPRGGFWREVGDGLRALPEGARALLATPRTKRLLIPPMVLTGFLFGAILVGLVRALSRFFEAVAAQDLDALGLEPGWWSDVVSWLAGLHVVVAIAHAGSILVLLVAFTIAGLWTFSIAYELIAGPFLDTIQARIETRWFDADPRALLERPPGPDPAAAARASAIAAGVSICAAVACFWIRAPWSWALLAVVPIAFAVAARAVPGSGSWALWFAGTQVRALWTSIKASALAALLLVAFVWLKFVPFLGLPLFAMVAGFATALTLLDIPFSRRGWSVSQRLAFLSQHLGGVLALGIVTSFVFVVPFLGPLVGVPCASIGGLWLLCRLDKNAMRPEHLRIGLEPPGTTKIPAAGPLPRP